MFLRNRESEWGVGCGVVIDSSIVLIVGVGFRNHR